MLRRLLHEAVNGHHDVLEHLPGQGEVLDDSLDSA
jgi:hypothetical protein